MSQSVQTKLHSARFTTSDLKQKSDNWESLVNEINIIQSLDFPCMRMTIAINDSVGMIKTLKGNEMVEIILEDTLTGTHTYFMRIYRIGPRVRYEKNEKYVLECVSNEFILNEVTNIFKCYKDKRADEVISEILTNELGTKKGIFIEKTKDNIKCVVPNWRPFDVVNWLGSKAVRSENQKQSGFIFYENPDGFHFKSFDKIIKDAKEEYKKKTNRTVPTYGYFMKNLGEDSTGKDIFNIQSISFPNLFDSLYAVRNGHWSGAFVGVSLDFISNSKVPTNGSPEIPYGGSYFNILDVYNKMEHLGNIKPYEEGDQGIKSLMQTPRRVRYRANQLHLWDSDKAKEIQPSTGEYISRWEDTAIYTHCRKVNFEAIKLSIKVPGYLKLNAGNSVFVEIPDTVTEKGKIQLDKIYTGLYIIAGVRHKYSGGESLISELDLVKDSLGDATPK
jgi:hypothetical protein